MTDAQPLAETIEQMLDEILFANPDPRIQRLKGVWGDARREADELFARADAENYQARLDYHRTCGNPEAVAAARGEQWALRQLLEEQKEERLGGIKKDITERVNEVLAELKYAE